MAADDVIHAAFMMVHNDYVLYPCDLWRSRMQSVWVWCDVTVSWRNETAANSTLGFSTFGHLVWSQKQRKIVPARYGSSPYDLLTMTLMTGGGDPDPMNPNQIWSWPGLVPDRFGPGTQIRFGPGPK